MQEGAEAALLHHIRSAVAGHAAEALIDEYHRAALCSNVTNHE